MKKFSDYLLACEEKSEIIKKISMTIGFQYIESLKEMFDDLSSSKDIKRQDIIEFIDGYSKKKKWGN